MYFREARKHLYFPLINQKRFVSALISATIDFYVKLHPRSEKPFVCLRYFRIRENTFTLSSRKTIVRPYLRQPLLNLCNRGKRERAGANFTTVSVKPFVRPRIFAQQKCTLLARNGILSVLRNRVHTAVGVLGTVGGANAVKAPSSLKVKATDAAFLFSLRSQYRLP